MAKRIVEQLEQATRQTEQRAKDLMTTEDKKAMIARIRRAVETPDDFVNDLYSAGKLNDLIVGAIRVTLYNLNYSDRDIEDAVYECQHGTFDICSACDLRQAHKKGQA